MKLSTFRASRGFTLIEVMIVVAIVGILAAVALPAYSDYVRRGQVPQGLATLADYRIKMEQYYQDNRAYGTAACADGANAPGWSGFARDNYFSYACNLTGNGQGYLITATGRDGTRVKGNDFTVDQANQRTTVNYRGNASGKPCWLVRGDEC
ncbi:type IV pilin protein [Pelomonas sp. CA6]|uniref:type IV pilin protein n=1 Tax=Pelomonas sp. CA6 TaxID=2907999 RepID=UPI0024083C58|nr:type IV pilin protein [Pelomonas sp. CA6]